MFVNWLTVVANALPLRNHVLLNSFSCTQYVHAIQPSNQWFLYHNGGEDGAFWVIDEARALAG